MRRSISSKGKKLITVSMAGLLTVAIVGGTIYSDSTTAMARPSLPGIESIVNANSKDQPFKILEIVDDYSSARIGYTVANEEPGDINTADAISDMASQRERVGDSTIDGRYMTAATTTKDTDAFKDLADKAFTYEEYSEDKETIDDTTTGVRTGHSYGNFEPSDDPGRYIETNTGDVYAPVSKDHGDDGNLTIDDVENKDARSDKSGIFYMDYVFFDNTETGTLQLNLKEYTADDVWKKPFRSYSDGTDYFYNSALYVKDKAYTYVEDMADTVEPEDDVLTLSETPVAGDTIFELEYGATALKFVGHFDASSDDTDDPDVLSFYDASGDEMPIDSTYDEIIPGYTDSFAKLIYESGDGIIPSEFFTIREEGGSDAALTKYYVDSTDDTGFGMYEASTVKKREVNDPLFPAKTYGIVDESGTDPAWYHIWYYKKSAAEPFTYVGAGNGDYDFIHDYAADSVNDFYYKGGYKNKEWFKKEVLDIDADDCKSTYVDVVTKKMSDVTPEDVYSAKLIYFTGGSYDADMQERTAAAIIKDIVDNNKAVILNLSCYFDDVYDKKDDYPVASILMNLLLSRKLDGIDAYVDSSDESKLKYTDTAKQRLYDLADDYKAVVESKDLSHVEKTVFIQDDITSGANKDAIYSDFTAGYSDAKINGFSLGNLDYDGFKEVKVDIDEEIFYLSVAGKDVSTFNSTISKATSIRYILNFGNRRAVAKTGIKVLDIEPYYNRDIEKAKNTAALSRIYGKEGNTFLGDVTVNNIANIRDIFDVDWYKKNISDSTSDVSVTGMGTKEFIGKIEDLNENYDLIYIGMDTAYMNTALTKTADGKYQKTKNVIGNSVQGRVYLHNGDIIQTSGIHGTDGQYAMGGNDITPDKLRELQMYIRAGYAVLLSDEFFDYNNNGTIAKITDRIDPNSNMYKLVDWTRTEKYLGKNVEITSNFEAARPNNRGTTDGASPLSHKESFVKYLNISKLEVEIIEEPPLYNTYDGSTEHQYIAMNADGLYTLDFKFKLTNDAATDTTKTTYDCQLYIDHDGDGRYEAVEALDSLLIYNMDNGDLMSVDSNGKYSLTTGSTYSLTRRVPEGYVGIIPWKLVFIENNRDTDLIKVSHQDYSAISDLTSKPTIKILQLTSNNSSTTNLDLKGDPTLVDYYKQVKDFNINVEQDTVANYINNNGTGGIFTGGDRLEKLFEYDMLVLGFIDMYRFTDVNNKSEEAMFALREYILSGRSVLFTHDLTSTVITANHADKSWGYLANIYLRDVQGMDRYGVVKNNLVGKKYNGLDLTEYKSKYDTVYPVNGDKWGFCDPTLLRYNSNNSLGEIAAKDTRLLSGGERELTSVARVNRGQVTEYPFRIGALEQSKLDSKYYAKETIEVATTHHQYFQLNMETDYTDDNYDDDIVVWYAISSDANNRYYHRLNYNDVRNNYYIFNKGNITYTGAGHSKINDNSNSGNAEKKLFVNTLVAAYNAGTHAPYASYKSNETIGATDISSLYIPYDIAMAKTVDEGGEGSGWLDDSVTVFFKTVNNNLQDNKLPLIAQYYVEVPNNTGDIKIGGKEYKIIAPVKMRDCTIGVDYNLVENPNAYKTLTNGHVYKMEFEIEGDNGIMYNSNVNERYSAKIYTRMRAQTKNKTVEDDISDLASTETIQALPASDSFMPLAVNFTQLYDLQ